jgi:hypothetical protein
MGGGTDLSKLNIVLYIKLTIGHTPKGEGEKNYLVCSPVWGKPYADNKNDYEPLNIGDFFTAFLLLNFKGLVGFIRN